ncbi:hypothetical protein L915_11297 [Phytophthora nicotianae]|nr:hypothetical protein L915_11297 [Phytophthora nicotianae]
MLQFVMSQWRNVRQKKIAEYIEGDLKEALKTEDRHAFSDADVKREFEISSSDNEECCTGDAANSDAITEKNPPVSSVSIRLNPKARKVGVPKKAKKKIVAGERAERKWYEAAEEGRKKAGEVTLLAVVNSLDHVQPGLREVQRRLSGIIVKYGDAESRKPKLHMMKNPVLIQDPFYLLSTKLLEACIKILPVSNSKEDAITIDASQTSQPTEEKTGKLVETIVIKDVNAKRIYYYDPLNHASYRNACNAVGTHLKISGLLDYEVIAMNNPIQFDGHSCGVFVGWMFICQVPGNQRRLVDQTPFELFYYLLSGHLLPVGRPTSHDTMEDDDKEEKTPAPRNAEDDDAGDEVQHTQRAARINDAEDEVSPTQRAARVDDAKSEVLPTQPAQ